MLGARSEKKPPVIRKRSRRVRIGEAWLALLEQSWLWAGLFLICGVWALMPEGLLSTPEIETGVIAQRNFTAPRDLLVLDEETTEAKRARAREALLPVYDFDRERAAWLESQLFVLFQEARTALEESPELDSASLWERLTDAQVAPTLRITDEQLSLFGSRDYDSAMEERLDGVWRNLMTRGVVANKELLLENRLRGITLRNLSDGSERTQVDLFDYVGYPSEARTFLDNELSRWTGWNRSERQVLSRFLTQNITPNLSFNLQETSARLEAAGAGVEPALNQIKRGQILVRRGDEITQQSQALIREAFGARSSGQWLPVLGNVLLMIMVLGAVRFGLERTNIGQGREPGTLGALLLLMGLALLAARLGIGIATTLGEGFRTIVPIPSQAYLFVLPYAGLSLVVSLFYGRGVGLLSAVLYSLVVGRMLGDDALLMTLFVASGSMAAVFALERLNRRLAVTRAGMVVGLVGVVSAAMLYSFEPGDQLREFGFLLAAPLVGGFLVSAVVSFLVPVLESVLGHTTEIRLIELSDTNLPLLRRMAFEAPGSFQHSLMVANLAKAGCEAIGANPVLAYTGALYHDIGKLTRPAYFVENQHGVNPHDKLTPSMSALIVLNHVKEGADLARENRLPRPIIDAIEQHHGTRLLKFFYEKAKDGAGSDAKVDEHKYCYPGPKPQSKTMGVLMYADAVEAASRTLRNPSPNNIDSLLRSLLNACLAEDQFDDSDLTFADLRKVREAFARALQTIYHKRIDYPGFDFEGAAKAELRMIRGGGV